MITLYLEQLFHGSYELVGLAVDLIAYPFSS